MAMNIIKTGSTFCLYLEVFNYSEGAGIPLEDISIKSIIVNADDEKIDDVDLEILDQTEFPGYVILTVKQEKTKFWKEGELFVTIRMEFNDMVLKTDSLKFFVEKDINE